MLLSLRVQGLLYWKKMLIEFGEISIHFEVSYEILKFATHCIRNSFDGMMVLTINPLGFDIRRFGSTVLNHSKTRL